MRILQSFVLILFFVSCRERVVEKLGPNSVVDGLEQGHWKVYNDGLQNSFSEGEFNRGIKVGMWLYVFEDTSYYINYKRSPVIAGPLRLSMPVSWEMRDIEEMEFSAVDTLGNDVLILANLIEAPHDSLTLHDFVAESVDAYSRTSFIEIQSCKLAQLVFNTHDSLVISRIEFYDSANDITKLSMAILKKVGKQLFLESSVAGAISDSIRIGRIYSDWVPNVIVDERKIMPHGSVATQVQPWSCNLE